jgi:hypothetical protein
MIAHDHLLAPWFDARPWAPWALDAVLVVGVIALGWFSQRKRPAALSERV